MKALLLLICFFALPVSSQVLETRIPLKDKEAADRQAHSIFEALLEIKTSADDLVFPIFVQNRRVAYGVSIGNESLITKASEVSSFSSLVIAMPDGGGLRGEISGIYSDHDLAVLKVPGLTAKAATWADGSDLEAGSILAAIRPDGEAQAMGVLSVRERSLKTSDQGFLGIQMSPGETEEGVVIEAVVPDSAAAEVGLQKGDVVIEIGGEKIRGFYELSTRLRRLKAGEKTEIVFERAGEKMIVQPTLRPREVAAGQSARLNQMDRMSGPQSRVRGGFSNVLQSDMILSTNDVGLPVVDLEGRLIGLVLARAGRISTLILPGDDIIEILKGEPEAFQQQARVFRPELQQRRNDRRSHIAGELERMRLMMEDLQREFERELKND